MIKIFKNLGYLMILNILMITTSCNKLKLQDQFVFNPEVPTLTPFKDMTCWEWIQTNQNNEFNYLISAIKLTGMQAEYDANPSPRTYILLKDTAFKDSRNLLKDITGSATGTIDSAHVTPAKIEALRNVLKYHIINDYFDQGPDYLKLQDVDYFYRSLFPGPYGMVSVRRGVFLAFSFNQSGTFPASKYGIPNNVQHNYVFKNGIAVLVRQYIRQVTFF